MWMLMNVEVVDADVSGCRSLCVNGDVYECVCSNAFAVCPSVCAYSVQHEKKRKHKKAATSLTLILMLPLRLKTRRCAG